ncbi:radical SAM protein, partial [bacterium]|nr:radical SAM protein [bacterium]
LAEVLPLRTPFVVQIFPFYGCNFKCNYCIFSVEKNQRHFISDKVVMDFDLFKKSIDDMSEFPDKIKVLRFVGIGEPLLHKKIVLMVEYAASKDVANVIEILTNASLLTPRLSDDLIAAGLSRLVVSLQGTSRDRYRKVCGASIDFRSFTENLRYFYNNKGRSEMYLKIIDCALEGEEDKEAFYEIFGDICDTMAIEHAVPIHSGVDYGHLLSDEKLQTTQFGLPVSEIKICPQSFFTMQINPDGKIVPCYSFEYPIICGDCRKESVVDIWDGEKLRKFRLKMLEGINNFSAICANCNMIKYRLFPEDNLNDEHERLKALYKAKA